MICRRRKQASDHSFTSGGRAGWTVGLLPAVVLLVAGLVEPAAAEDVVYISSRSSAQGYAKLTGRILDYTGLELRLEMPGGVEQSYPAEKVLRIETQQSEEQSEADALFARREFASALALYSQARNEQSRAWVRRQITAQIVWCHQGLEQPVRAGEEFLVLIRSDARTPYFDCIPLAWIPSEPSSLLERSARQWLAHEELSAAVLLGASHLLATALRPTTLARLRQLSTDPDRRIAAMALAQTWRASAVTADDRQLRSWQRAVDAMPERLRAGPYFVLGQGWARLGQWEEASLAFLHVPILYSHHRTLAASALLGAGKGLEKLDRPREAARVYHELVDNYAESRPATEARGRLEEMSRDDG